jgi:hypothetical protein
MAANYVLLGEITVSTAVSSVTFSNIPQSGYTDLIIKASTRTNETTGGSVWDALLLRFNGSSSNYSDRAIGGDGSTAFSFANAFPNYIFCGDIANALVTANTFSSTEITIPNYLSSNFKTLSIDSVEENNSSTAQLDLTAGLWSNTSAISSITLSGAVGSFVPFSTFYLYGVAALGTTPVIAPKASGGDIIVNDGTYWYHAFLASSVFTPNQTLSCDVLVVAGGGGVSTNSNGVTGGGGAGGVIYFANQSLVSANYACTIGGGGPASSNGTNGTNSTFASLTAAVGGGSGGGWTGNAPGNGGSGGGSRSGAGGTSTQTGTGATAFYGNAGATASNFIAGGGGGGAGAAGTAGTADYVGGNGGNGVTAFSSWGSATGTGENISGTYYYAGGGAGYASNTGGFGGGGNNTRANGVANTGGGGTTSGSGGSGIVIVRYTVA